jgi:ribosomal protein S18 acetylase RimI-like enzyme
MTIRRLVPSDVQTYRELMLEAYELHPDAFTSSHAERDALPLAWWESRLAVGPLASEIVLGTFQSGQLAGVAGLSFESREKTRHKATLFGMYIPARFRHRGLGRQLVLAVLEQAKARGGLTIVQLTVTQGNTGAHLLYEKCGFVQFGLEPFAIANGPEFFSKIHMWRDLGLPHVAAQA